MPPAQSAVESMLRKQRHWLFIRTRARLPGEVNEWVTSEHHGRNTLLAGTRLCRRLYGLPDGRGAVCDGPDAAAAAAAASDLRSGETRLLDERSYCGKGGPVPGGAATVLHLPLHAERELASVRVERDVRDCDGVAGGSRWSVEAARVRALEERQCEDKSGEVQRTLRASTIFTDRWLTLLRVETRYAVAAIVRCFWLRNQEGRGLPRRHHFDTAS